MVDTARFEGWLRSKQCKQTTDFGEHDGKKVSVDLSDRYLSV